MPHQRPYEVKYSRKPVGLGAPSLLLVTLLFLRLPASATGGGRLRHRLKSARGGCTAGGRWDKASREKKAKRKAGQKTCFSFWLSLLDLNQRPTD